MTQQEAMEHAKEFLRQVIKYRFWISISVGALFALIAYFVGSGPVRAKADAATKKIKFAENDVKQYVSPTIPTKEYKPIVEEKTRILTKDVNAAWKTLFDLQAPLLTWPDTVQERFRKWGRKWPESTDPRKVELAIVDYIEAYPAYVAMVYKTFKPFDFETGDGLVVAPPQEALLRPSSFSQEHLPDLGKVWAAQERLWIQHTLLEVVAQVNKNAKGWDSAIVRQIEALEVGNPSAQDQRSLAKNETLEESPGIYAQGEEPAATESAGANVSYSGMSRGGGMGGMMGSKGGGGFMGGATASESVYYVKAGNEEQYKILPVSMTVLIDQDHIQDFLVELENSPMSILVMDFELRRPNSQVSKPEKGTSPAGQFGMMGDMMGHMGGMRGMMGMGGMASQMQQQMREQMQQQMKSQMAQQMGGMGAMMRGAMGGRGGMGAAPEKKGKSVRDVDRNKQRAEKEKAITQSKGPMMFDPYFNIVQVTIYGKARFFSPPPEDAAAEPSPGEVAGATIRGAAPAVAAPKGAPAPDAPEAPDRAAEKSEAATSAAGATPKTKDSDEDGKPAAKSADGAEPNSKDSDEAGKPAAKSVDGAAPKTEDDADADQPSSKPDSTKTKPKGAAPKS